MNRFNNDAFDKRQNNFRRIFWGIFIVAAVLIAIQFTVIGTLGYKAIEEVNENNGSVAKTLGSFYKDFKEASMTDAER